MIEPIALREQSCVILLSGATITIECENRDEAEELQDWIAAQPMRSELRTIDLLIEGFGDAPPENEFQRGFISALRTAKQGLVHDASIATEA